MPTKAELEILYQVSRDLNMAQDVGELLSILARPAQKAGIQETTLFYVDLNESNEPEWVELAAVWRLEGEPAMPVGSRIYLPEFPFSHLWTRDPNNALLVADFATDERIDVQSRQAMLGLGIVATAIIPLRHAGRWVGILSFTWNEPHEFSRQEAAIYNGFIDLAAPVLANRRLMGEREVELQASKEMAASAINSLPGVFYLFDSDGTFINWNKNFETVTGYTAKEIATMHPLDFFVEEEKPKIAETMQTIFELGEGAVEGMFLSKDGSQTPYSFVGSRTMVGGEPCLIGMGIDITEQKRAEQALQESEARSRSIVESLPMGMHMYHLEPDGQLVFVGANPAADRLLGVDNSMFVGKAIEDAFPPLAATEVPAHYRAAAAEGRAWQTEQVEYDEGEIQGAFEVYAFQTSPGNMVAAFLDVTERKRAEREREQLQKQAIEAQQRAIKELSTPVIPLMKTSQGGILVMPLVGSIDSMRAKDLMRTLLAGISQHRAKVVILDVTGVPLVDSGVANHLNKTIMAARLKGARTIITGITDAVAETIVDLGIDWSGIETLSDLQTGLVAALGNLGIKLSQSR